MGGPLSPMLLGLLLIVIPRHALGIRSMDISSGFEINQDNSSFNLSLRTTGMLVSTVYIDITLCNSNSTVTFYMWLTHRG